MLDEKLLDDAIMAGFQDTVFGKEAGWSEFAEGMKIMVRGIKSSFKAEEPMYRANMKARSAAAKAAPKEPNFTMPGRDTKVEPQGSVATEAAAVESKAADALKPNDKSKDKNWKHMLGYSALGVGVAGAGGAGGYFFGRKKGQEDVINQLNQPQA